MKRFLQRLASGEVLVADGAIGTMLMERGLQPGQPPESFNLTHTDVLEDVARAYLEAGADIIQTNTFGANRLKLQTYGLGNKVSTINRNAVLAVKKVVGEAAYVYGSCGPTGRFLEPYGEVTVDEMYEVYLEQIGTLCSAGVDIICIETMSDLNEAACAIRAAKDVAQVPVIATMTFDHTPKGYYTIMGVTVKGAAGTLQDAGADIVGSNCGNGIEKMVTIAREFRQYTKLPVAIQANAGKPQLIDDRAVYPETPDFMAERTGELLSLGVSIIGGCCGTTPAHIRALRKAVDSRKE
jgi:5-methyltetrahydrofolate--homocysteine methyltransferase